MENKAEITPALEALMELQVAVYWKMGKRDEVLASARKLHALFPKKAPAPKVFAEYEGPRP